MTLRAECFVYVSVKFPHDYGGTVNPNSRSCPLGLSIKYFFREWSHPYEKIRFGEGQQPYKNIGALMIRAIFLIRNRVLDRPNIFFFIQTWARCTFTVEKCGVEPIS